MAAISERLGMRGLMLEFGESDYLGERYVILVDVTKVISCLPLYPVKDEVRFNP